MTSSCSSSKPDADALQWCDMGLQLMRHLSSLRENYETQVRPKEAIYMYVWNSMSVIIQMNYLICSVVLCGKYTSNWNYSKSQSPLQWRHNGCDGVPNQQPHDCLLNRFFKRISKKTSKLRVTGLCVGNSPVIGEFPAQMAGNAKNVSIWWRHHVFKQARTGIIIPFLHIFVLYSNPGQAYLGWRMSHVWNASCNAKLNLKES